MKAKLLLFAALWAIAPAVHASDPHSAILADKMLSTANHRFYPAPDSAATLAPAPAGYVPYHISTYARHGSRYLIGRNDYLKALEPLQKASAAGVLTPDGQKAMSRLEKMQAMAAEGRFGELTPGGAQQHRGIARRMYHNFPEVFAGEAPVLARSTDVMRCAMSMMAECLELQSLNPQIKIDHDASSADLHVLNNWQYADSLRKLFRPQRLEAVKVQKEQLDPKRLMGTLFTDSKWASENLPNEREYMWQLFFVASNMQSHTDPELDLMWLFTPEECYKCWLVNNVEWYMMVGNSPLTNSILPYQQLNLLLDFIADGDRYAASREQGATLRFGHESVLIPTVVLMGIENYGYSTDNLDTLADHWADYEIFPMAANLQFVFYQNPDAPDSDVLVRVMLNEKDVHMPAPTDSWPFYKWADLRRSFNNVARACPKELKK